MKKIILLIAIMLVVSVFTASAWDPNPMYDPFEIIWNYLANISTSWKDGAGKVTTNVSVGIGTDSPVTKLQVDGRILSNEPIAFSTVTLWNNHRYDPSKMQHRLGVSAGLFHTCVLRSNGNVYCYGSNLDGQSEDYSNGDAIGVSAGYYHTCVLKTNGNVDCYGNDLWGQAADYSNGDAIGVSAGYYHTCVLKADGDVDCYGNNLWGQAADYSNGDAIGVSTGMWHTCVLKSNGDVDCYGYDGSGRAANYTSGDAIGVSAGGSHTCVLKSNGNVDCYGQNIDGESEDYSNGDAIGVSAGYWHTCVLKSNGNVDCYGNNGYGQAADYTSGDAKNPFNSLWRQEDDLWSVSGEDVYRMNGNVGIGTTNPAGKLDVNGKIMEYGYELLPTGVIVMWSGNLTSIPQGWALCDGTQGTPDLSGRFIVGYDENDSDYDGIGDLGGEKNHTLTLSEMPSHRHSYSGNTEWAGEHRHTSPPGDFLVPGDAVGDAAGSHFADTTRYTDPDGYHAHSYSGNTNYQGSNAAHENRPPYYTLAFIMKL